MNALLLVVWLPFAAFASVFVWRIAMRDTRSRAAAVLGAAMMFAALAVFPDTLRDTAAAARRFEKHRRAQDDRPEGPRECLTFNFNRCVRTRVMDEVRALIPEEERYYVQTDSGMVRFWSFTALLPRVAVGDPRDADWVLSYRADPRELGLRFSSGRTIRGVFANGRRSLTVRRVAR